MGMGEGVEAVGRSVAGLCRGSAARSGNQVNEAGQHIHVQPAASSRSLDSQNTLWHGPFAESEPAAHLQEWRDTRVAEHSARSGSGGGKAMCAANTEQSRRAMRPICITAFTS